MIINHYLNDKCAFILESFLRQRVIYEFVTNKKIKSMKEKIIELIARTHDLALTAFKSYLPEIKGDYDYYFPAKDIPETNILLIAGVSDTFINALGELINEDVLTFAPCSILVVNFDGGEMYQLPLVEKPQFYFETVHWLPIIIKKGKNFSTVPTKDKKPPFKASLRKR